MNLTHKGKIGRLPKAIQEQVNRRLDNGEKSRHLVKSLNSLPEVQAVLTAEFGGKPIREQNISQWRKTGYQKWLRQQETLEIVNSFLAETDELGQTTAEPLTEKLALLVITRYVVEMRNLGDKAAGGELDRKLLREFCSDIVDLRRGNHSAARLKIEQERLEREREKTEEEVLAQFKEWAKNSEVRDLICRAWVSPEEQERQLGEKFGLPSEEVSPAPSGSNQIKPL